MKLDTLEKDFHDIVVDVIAEANAATGRNWVCVQGRRTIAEQNGLYAQGRTKPGSIVTNAKGGQSAHNFGLAADLVPEKSKGLIDWNASHLVWKTMGDIAIKHGLIWGGTFKSIKDLPHIEHPRWKEQQALYRAGKANIP
jgi:peptidoglycan LD-endopeptidase CwlK